MGWRTGGGRRGRRGGPGKGKGLEVWKAGCHSEGKYVRVVVVILTSWFICRLCIGMDRKR